MELLKGMGIELKSHMSTISDEEIERIRASFDKAKESAKEEYARQQERLRARTMKPAPPPPAPEKRPRTGTPPAPAPAPATTATLRPVPSGPAGKGRGKLRGGRRRPVVDEKAVQESVRRTLAQIEGGGKVRRRRRRVKEDGTVVEEDERIRVPEFTSTSELARVLGVAPNEVIRKCLDLGVMVTMNQRLDRDTIQTVADEFGFEVEFLDEYSDEAVLAAPEDSPASMRTRPPVVTVMGHVDHGKTSLLDFIRRTNVIAGEAGGITQHMGAYEVVTPGGHITFLDTPGHEAFSAMRARGAEITDIVVLVVAADEGVRPQTIEAIDHALSAQVPILVAMNKMDLPGANPDKLKQELAQRGVMVEEYGGKSPAVPCSAKTGMGMDKLLEIILLQAELMELKAHPERPARCTVVEAELDPGRGVLVTAIVQDGTLRIGDMVVAGQTSGKVRALLDERGRRIQEGGPSTPVRILGIDGMPQAGDTLIVVAGEREAREISTKRRQMHREHEFRYQKRITLADLSERISKGEIRDLNVVVKGDVDGSVGAVCDSLVKLTSEEVQLRVLHRSVGAVNLSDVLLAAAADAIILAFHVPVEPQAAERARREGVDIRGYQVIYEAVEDVKAAMLGMMQPRFEEKILGVAEVRQIFRTSKFGAVAGSYVLSGAIPRNARVRVRRGESVIFDGKFASLRRFKDDVREVAAGFECGIGVEGFGDIEEKDLLEAYQRVEVKP